MLSTRSITEVPGHGTHMTFLAPTRSGDRQPLGWGFGHRITDEGGHPQIAVVEEAGENRSVLHDGEGPRLAVHGARRQYGGPDEALEVRATNLVVEVGAR